MKTLCVLLCAAAAFAQLHVDSVKVDSVWNSDSASRVSRDCRVNFIPQGTGWVSCSLYVSSDGGTTFWNGDSAFIMNDEFWAIHADGNRKTLTLRVLGSDRENFVVRIKIRRPDPSLWPAWRQAGTVRGRIYPVTHAGGKTWLGETDETCNGIFTDGYRLGACALAYGGNGGIGVYSWSGGGLMETGGYGTVVTAQGGHGFWNNQIYGVNLNTGEPGYVKTFTYDTSAAGGAEMYFNRREATALPANRRFYTSCDGQLYWFAPGEGYTNLFQAQTDTFWDKSYPVAVDDAWVIPAATTHNFELGNEVPPGRFRYETWTEVPAAYTGIGEAVTFFGDALMSAPWLNDNATFTPDGLRHQYIYYFTHTSRQWHRVPGDQIPSVANVGSPYFCQKQMRLYYSSGYRDLSGGVDNTGSHVSITTAEPGPGYGQGCYDSGSKAVTNGHPRLNLLIANGYATVRPGMDWEDTLCPALIITDLDSVTPGQPVRRPLILRFPDLRPWGVSDRGQAIFRQQYPTGPQVRYWAARNQVVLFHWGKGEGYNEYYHYTPTVYIASLPEDWRNASAWSWEKITCDFGLPGGRNYLDCDGAGITYHAYGGVVLHEQLECLLFPENPKLDLNYRFIPLN